MSRNVCVREKKRRKTEGKWISIVAGFGVVADVTFVSFFALLIIFSNFL